MRVAYLAFVIPLVGLLSAESLAGSLDEGVDRLAGQIVTGLAEGKKQKIAVVEFSDLDGKVTEFGKFLSEELITRLFSSKRFNVVERQLLAKILEEHKLNLSGLVEPMTAQKLGRLLGVDAICSGTVTDLVDSVRVNARLISTDTGEVFAVASGSIGKDTVVQKLLGKVSYVSTITESVGSGRSAVEGKVFFFEDFSAVDEGLLPPGWIADDDVIVHQSTRLAGKKCLYNTSLREHRIVISPVSFPENWIVELTIKLNAGGASPYYQVSLGGMLIRFGNNYDGTNVTVSVGGIARGSQNLGYRVGDDKIRVIQLERRGGVFKLSTDGREIFMARQSAFKRPTGIILESDSFLAIYKVVCREL